MMLYSLHDALLKPMPSGFGTLSLAVSWTMSKDGLMYEFVLRNGIKFHTGDPVTAEDVKFSFERYRGAGAKQVKSRVREVQVVDPSRIRFHLVEPWPDFLTYYGTTAAGIGWVVPKKYVEKVGDEGFKNAPVGAGPFRFVSFTPGSNSCPRRSRGIGARRRVSTGSYSRSCPTTRLERPPSRRET
jgi:peptide/nickel transport system substrate-binding protein